MSRCLEIGPFPGYITKDHKEALLLNFGAEKVIHIKKKLKENYMIGIFPSHQKCKHALLQLHQADIHGKRLVAVYCKRDIEHLQEERNIEHLLKKDTPGNSASTIKRNIQSYEAKLSAISSKFNILHPISPLLRYAYPPPSENVLANIAHYLVSESKFYTQVVHLMNKMNLPCPFGKPAPVVTNESDHISNKNTNIDVIEADRHDTTTSESEMELDEDVKNLYSRVTTRVKRTKRRVPKMNKKPKLELLQQSFNTTPKDHKNTTDISDIFDAKQINKQKNVQLILPNTAVVTFSVDDIATEGFGKILPVEVKTKKPERNEFITSGEIEANKINESEWPIVPVFKNYSSGEPTSRLYVKNLAKTVLEQDLKFVFGKYINWHFPDEVSEFSIKLMKEGRMKGQAFITYHSVQTAKAALEEINGYILKDKPMVIAYSKRKTTQ